MADIISHNVYYVKWRGFNRILATRQNTIPEHSPQID